MVRKIHSYLKNMAFNFFRIPQEVQVNLFKSCGFNRDFAFNKINEIINILFNEDYNEENEMFSEHLVLFAAISLSNRKIFSILEIGTYDGKTALILSKLFAHANITTIDLPNVDKKFYETYGRKKNLSEFVSKRNQLISRCENIKFKEMNSLKLLEFTENFDLD
jgi:hypothetical protein